MDSYEIIPEVTTHQDLGKWLVEHDRLEEQVPESLRPYLDYRSIGMDYCREHDGVFLESGYRGTRAGAAEQAVEEARTMLLTLTISGQSYPLALPASEEHLEQAKRALGLDGFSQAVIAGVEYVAPYLDQLIPTDRITVPDWANNRWHKLSLFSQYQNVSHGRRSRI